MKFWCDGSGFNGKESKYCIVNEKGLVHKHKTKDKYTNNEMEYKAVIHALQIAQDGDIIYTDSRLVCEQLMQICKVKKEHLFALWTSANELLKNKNIKIEWISRKENRAGWLLEK